MTKKNKALVIKKGEYDLKRDLIVPRGHVLIIEAGTKIRLAESVKIISFSPVYFDGSEEQKIIIQGSERSQGFAVINAKEKSMIKHTNFFKLSNPKDIDWSLSGAVTFYNSPISMSHVKIDTNYCEDALNIKNTDFSLDNLYIANSQSDAFDSDFSDGKLNNVIFENIGNDAVDTSGSRIEARDVEIRGVGDKGLSFGEASIAKITNVSIKDAEIGVAAKDTSLVNIEDLDLANINVGFTVFRKKPEYKGAKIEVSHLVHEKIKVMDLVEKKSELIVDGKEHSHAKGAVKEMLYGIMFGKKTEKTLPAGN